MFQNPEIIQQYILFHECIWDRVYDPGFLQIYEVPRTPLTEH